MAGKGQPKTGGRTKGTANTLTTDVKTMVLQALEQAGGVAYLLEQAQGNPNAFLTLVGKVMPTQIAADITATVTAIERRIVRPTD